MSLLTFDPCDKCGTHVPENNSVIRWEVFQGNISAGIAPRNRHFDEVFDSNKVRICEGSPSRRKVSEEYVNPDTANIIIRDIVRSC